VPVLVPPVLAPGCLADRAQPRLAVDELDLRPWSAADAPAVAAAYRDPDIQRWHVWEMDESEALTWVASWPERWSRDEAASWAVVDAGDVLLGRMGFQKLNQEDAEAHVAYWVVPAARHRGVASRALSAMTTYAFSELGLHRLQLDHSSGNDGSCGVARRAGYPVEGTLRRQVLHADGWHDMHVHARVSAPGD
jgi:RimJ/RimL family protein N-acetyltransferase